MSTLFDRLVRLFRPQPAPPPDRQDSTTPSQGPQGPVRELRVSGYRILLDLGPQVIGLEVPQDVGSGLIHEATEAPVSPVLPRGWQERPFVSAAAMAQKAKIFDDGLYAAVDLLAQRGGGRFAGKAALLQALCPPLAAQPQVPGDNVAAVLCGAARLSSLPVDLPPGTEAEVQRTLSAFLADELRSKPIGFYTWTKELSALFQQDRLLQTGLRGTRGIESLVRALHGTPQLRDTYEGYLQLVSKLTNALSPDRPDLRPLLSACDRGALAVPEAECWFFPPSRAHETDLMKRLYGDRPIPDGFNLADEMIRAIRSGALDLAPGPTSGWYDYQSWALEPLVVPERMPESGKLHLGKEYRQMLAELFKGLLALTRETHIKQLEVPLCGCAPMGQDPLRVTIEPDLTAEPLPSYYLRRAQGYTFLRRALCELLGEEALRGTSRQTPSGPVQRDLLGELSAVEALFYGAHAAVSAELGHVPDPAQELHSGAGKEADEITFRQWAAALDQDGDLSRDVRMMVPVFYDVQRRKTKVWVVLGWAERPANIYFNKPPAARVTDPSGKDASSKVRLEYQGTYRQVCYPVSAEVYVDRLMDRDEFRRHCDRYRTRSAILKNLR